MAQANTGYRLKDGKKADTGDKKQDEFRTEEEIVGDYRFFIIYTSSSLITPPPTSKNSRVK